MRASFVIIIFIISGLLQYYIIIIHIHTLKDDICKSQSYYSQSCKSIAYNLLAYISCLVRRSKTTVNWTTVDWNSIVQKRPKGKTTKLFCTLSQLATVKLTLLTPTMDLSLLAHWRNVLLNNCKTPRADVEHWCIYYILYSDTINAWIFVFEIRSNFE